MSEIFMVQPSEYVDHITPDGRELTRMPYPLYVDERGLVGRQDYWKGNPLQIIGLAEDFSVASVDLSWEEVTRDPGSAIGMYLVTACADGSMATHTLAVSRITIVGTGETSPSERDD